MPDGSPLPAEMFQFTSEELVMVPGILDALMPAHLKSQPSTYVNPAVSVQSTVASVTQPEDQAAGSIKQG